MIFLCILLQPTKKRLRPIPETMVIGNSDAGNVLPLLLLTFDVDDSCGRPIHHVIARGGYFPRCIQFLVVYLVSMSVDELVVQIIIRSVAVHDHVDGGSWSKGRQDVSSEAAKENPSNRPHQLRLQRPALGVTRSHFFNALTISLLDVELSIAGAAAAFAV